MFHLNKFITARKDQLPGRFSAMVKIYQSQTGKSSLFLKAINHILTFACLYNKIGPLRVTRRPNFLTKLPFVLSERSIMLHGTE